MAQATCSIDECDRKVISRGVCPLHYQRLRKQGSLPDRNRPTPEERFWAKVNKTETCWLWTAVIVGGYGKFWLDRHVGAHRFCYELLVGPVPDGLVLDHLCRVRHCVNPDHLEPVTHRENVSRGVGPTAINSQKTHCKRGHPFTKENTGFMRRWKEGDGTSLSRFCKTCHYDWKEVPGVAS